MESKRKENRIRDKVIMLRVTEQERDKIRGLAQVNAMKVSEYLRHLLTNLPPKH